MLRLRVQGVRVLSDVSLCPGPGINLITGGNGAGKSSLLESLVVLAHGRSFRSPRAETWIRQGAAEARIVAEWEQDSGVRLMVGLERRVDGWLGRIAGAPVRLLSDLLRCSSVVLFEPGSHGLVTGPAEARRRFLDYCLFHVEPEFSEVARRYQRSLAQRNALLRTVGSPREFDPWEQGMADAGERMQSWRGALVARLQDALVTTLAVIAPALEGLQLRLRPGWAEGSTLGDALKARRSQDCERRFTTVGAHRADLVLRTGKGLSQEHLSRGQSKLLSLALLLAQGQVLANQGEAPLLCLDDLPAELDSAHREQVLGFLASLGWQMLLTATDADLLPQGFAQNAFHVEQGQLQALL